MTEIKVRIMNVIHLKTLQSKSEHQHGLNDNDFDMLFTKNKLIILAFDGYPPLIHSLTYHRTNHDNLNVPGIKREASTPFDMVVMNDLERFHLANDVLDRLPGLGSNGAYTKQ